MKLEEFYKTLTIVVKEHGLKDASIASACEACTSFADEIIRSEVDDLLKMTRMTILFEAFSKSIQDGSPFKN